MCAVFRDLSGEMHTSGASAGRAWYGQGKRRKKYSVRSRRKNSRKNCRISHPREQEIWNRMGIQRREGLYFMRKKWEIEEEYRNFAGTTKNLRCRNCGS